MLEIPILCNEDRVKGQNLLSKLICFIAKILVDVERDLSYAFLLLPSRNRHLRYADDLRRFLLGHSSDPVDLSE